MSVRRRWPLALLLPLALEAGCARDVRKKSTIEADQTRPAEEWLKSEPVRLLRDYVRIDTRDEIGEKEGAEFLERLLGCAGIQTEIVCPAPRRCNLLARLPGRSRAGALLLVNHIDVARVSPPSWKEGAPFEGKFKLGYLYGRGTYDMKSLALAQALALRSVKEHGIVPESDILLLGEADEEGEQKWGTRWLLEHRPEWFEGVAVALNEGGTNEMILRDVRFWGVETVLAGYGFIELEAPSAEPLRRLSERWRKVEFAPVEPLPDVVRGFDMLANHLVHPLTDPLRHLDRVRRDPKELAKLPDRYGAFLEPRILWTLPYAYPAGATGNFRQYTVVSTPPGISPDVYLKPIREDAARSGVLVVQSISTGATTASPYTDDSGKLVPFMALLERVTQARYPGVPFGPVPTFGGATTSVFFRRAGIPTYGYSPVPFNITDAARRHGHDERIFLRDYVDGVDLYRQILEEFAFSPAGAFNTGQKMSHGFPGN